MLAEHLKLGPLNYFFVSYNSRKDRSIFTSEKKLLSTKAESLLPCNFVSIYLSIYLKLIEMCEHHIYTLMKKTIKMYIVHVTKTLLSRYQLIFMSHNFDIRAYPAYNCPFGI